ncbi:MAG TPA: DAK2 domain-containing protein, partial [Mycobacteriales bacterium]|nr:DAK2 domain-containing protein [Mycobacteriales bacterium]
AAAAALAAGGGWPAAAQAAAAGIAEIGGAEPGDRTMLDALVPAAAALPSGIDAAARAARSGADATAGMSPRRGRSSYLGERAVGHLDPGAEAVAVWFAALAE